MTQAMTMVEMSTDDFISLPRYAANRDETKRMKREHLNGDLISGAQRLVAAVRYPDGRIHKIDGHSRAEAWTRGQLEKPLTVYVNIYDIADEDGADALYDSYTSKGTAATPAEEFHTAQLRVGFTPVSRLCKGSWKSAFKLVGVDSATDGYKSFVNELIEIDSWGINESRSVKYGVAIKGAMLHTLSDNFNLAVEFWKDYTDESSSRFTSHLLKVARSQNGGGFYGVGVVFGQAIGQYEAFKAEKMQ